MRSIFELSREAVELASQLEEGEITPELENALVINQTELQQKAVNYAYVVKQIESDIDTIDEEIKRLQAIKKAKDNAVNRLKGTIASALQIYGLDKVETPTLKLFLRLNESIEVDENFDDKSLMTEKITYTPDKKRIKDAIKSGEFVAGARIVLNYNLQIK